MQRQSKNLYVAGISHKSDPVGLVGKCSMSADICAQAEEKMLKISGGKISEVAILSTCNRFEVYFAADAQDDFSKVLEVLKDNTKPDAEFAKYSYFKSDNAALRHLFEVASGLQSQMVGETEILGQVKAAYARAAESGHCGAILNAAFQKSLQCAKWVRTNTDVGHGKITLGSVCAELAARIFEDVDKAKILLIGSGDAGHLVADAMFVRGSHDITVVSRTRENADILAAKVGVKSDDISNALSSLENFDIVVCASRSESHILTFADVSKAEERRVGKNQFLIDLGVPRNIDPKCDEIEGSFLYTLEDISKIANENLRTRLSEIESARAEIARKADDISRRLWDDDFLVRRNKEESSAETSPEHS